jgi:hypothetical protein
MSVFVIFAFEITYLLSYLPMVYTMSDGCKFRYQSWFWETEPELYSLPHRKDAQPIRLAWSIDWQALSQKVLIVTIIALLAFVWIGDSKSGWRNSITNVMNGFTGILLSLGFVSIITALIGIILNHWDASKISQGQQQDYFVFVFFHKPIYSIRSGFYFASFLFPLSLAMSLASLVVDFKGFKRRYLFLCIMGLLLTLCVYVYHSPPPDLRWAIFSYFSDTSKWLPGRVIC